MVGYGSKVVAIFIDIFRERFFKKKKERRVLQATKTDRFGSI